MLTAFRSNAVFLTGASRGIGREMALQLARSGARLALMARNREDLERTADACRDCGALGASEELGSIDTLIANSGISMLSLFEDMEDLAPLERVMKVNYLGAVYCTRYALPELIAARGRLVAVSSLVGLTGVPTRTGYAASKHAMRGFFDSLRIEIARHGVSVTVAYPGFVDTGIRERAVGEGPGRPTGPHAGTRILRGAARRRREVVMTGKGRAGRWLKLVAPQMVDRVAARSVGFGA